MKFPRFLHRLYARYMGYFWLPCPVCGRYFGGHEVAGSDGFMLVREVVTDEGGKPQTLKGDSTCGHGNCPALTAAINEENFPGLFADRVLRLNGRVYYFPPIITRLSSWGDSRGKS